MRAPNTAELTLEVRLLGNLRIVRGNTLIELSGSKQQSLLAYLMLHRGTPLPRQQLAHLLWPDSPGGQARTNLRNLLHKLSQHIPDLDDWVHTTGQGLVWMPGGTVRLDIEELEAALAGESTLENMQWACEVYCGDLLPSCEDDWIRPERERIHAAFVQFVAKGISCLEGQRDYRSGIRFGERLVQVDPHEEAHYRRLMMLYALVGDRASALRQYAACAHALDLGLGVGPGNETRELYNRLRHPEEATPERLEVLFEETGGNPQRLADRARGGFLVRMPPASTPAEAAQGVQSGPPEAPAGIESTLPLRHRLPNPPTVFVGREREVELLGAALKRSPVALVCGPGGIGKTAMVLKAIPQLAGFELERTLWIDLRPGPPAEDPRVQIIQVLARARGLEWLNWSEILKDEDTAGGTLIDLAESGGWWIVLDDFQHVDPPVASALLTLLLRYARRSRWIVTSRQNPVLPELVPQVLHLDALPDDALRQLADWFDPTLPETAFNEALSASGGSPWMLQQLLAAPGEDTRDDPLLGGLPAAAREFLEALSTVDKALPLEVLSAVTPLPVQEMLTLLQRRGLIQHSYEGYRLHDVVRRILRTAQENGRRLPSPLVTGSLLCTQSDPNALLEGARILLNAGVIDDVVQMLIRHADLLIDEGHAPRLWQLFESSSEERLSRWRLRCAVALGQPSLLARLQPPTAEADLEVRLLWARALVLLGQRQDALDLSRAVLEEARRQGDGRRAFDAGLVVVECLRIRQRFQEGFALLETLEPPDRSAVAMRESCAAELLVCQGRTQESAARLRALKPLRDTLPGRIHADVLIRTAKVAFITGPFREAYESSRLALSLAPPSAMWLVVHCRHALSAGHYDEGKQLLDRLAPFRFEGSILRLYELLLTAIYLFETGELRDLPPLITRTKPEWRLADDAGLMCIALCLEYELKRLRAVSPTDLLDEDLHRLQPIYRQSISVYIQRWLIRSGEALTLPTPDERWSIPPWPGNDTLLRIMETEALLVSERPREALELCLHALDAAAESGYGALEVELRQLQCDLLLVLGRWNDLEQAAAALSSRAATMPSARYVSEARFFQAFLPSKPVDWGRLELLATLVDVAPIAARRARVLLGEGSPLDAVDRRVLAALQEHRGVGPATRLATEEPRRPTGAGTQWKPGWGLADDGCVVWTLHGESIDLSDRLQLWTLLVSLFERGGTATKEQLVEDLWREPSYHPLYHDNRLHVAIWKLRRSIEQDPSRPLHLVTTDQGYALAGQVRRVRRV